MRLIDFQEHFPHLYAKCFDFCVPDGWFDIVDELSGKLERMGGIECSQAKEKFGALRYHVGPASPEALALIAEAEAKSLRTCQECGAPGEPNAYRGWVRTTCERHRA